MNISAYTLFLFVDIDECTSNPCQNGGTCADDTGGYTCRCDVGTSGTHCELGMW